MPEFFVYKCASNDGLETFVRAGKDTTGYDERDCETLDRIVYWPDSDHEE